LTDPLCPKHAISSRLCSTDQMRAVLSADALATSASCCPSQRLPDSSHTPSPCPAICPVCVHSTLSASAPGRNTRVTAVDESLTRSTAPETSFRPRERIITILSRIVSAADGALETWFAGEKLSRGTLWVLPVRAKDAAIAFFLTAAATPGVTPDPFPEPPARMVSDFLSGFDDAAATSLASRPASLACSRSLCVECPPDSTCSALLRRRLRCLSALCPP
jgi:hypothetical protein